jgi:hypothetical protein
MQMLEQLKVWRFAEGRVCAISVVGRELCVRLVLVSALIDELVSTPRCDHGVMLIDFLSPLSRTA